MASGRSRGPLRPVFATWLGWLAPSDRPIVIVRDTEQDRAEIVWQAAKIGYDNLVGELACGIHAWTSAGYEIARTRMVRPDQVDGLRVLDIRQTPEFVAGHLRGAVHIELGDIADGANDLRREPTVVMCGHGERAIGAASLLERAGRRDLTVLDGGPGAWARATGRFLQTGA